MLRLVLLHTAMLHILLRSVEQCAGRVAQINFRFGCGADIPVCRFWGLSSPRIPRQTVSFGQRSWKTSQPAGSKACPTNLSNTPLGDGGSGHPALAAAIC